MCVRARVFIVARGNVTLSASHPAPKVVCRQITNGLAPPRGKILNCPSFIPFIRPAIAEEETQMPL